MRLRHLAIAAALLVAPAAVAAPPARAVPAEEAGPEPSGRLAARLAPLFADPALEGAEVAIQVVDVETGEEVFGLSADRPMIAASVTKLLTSAAALRALGPAYRFETVFLSVEPPDAEGVLHGDLYLRGNGDPTLVVETLWKMVGELRLHGVEAVEGDLVLDDSWFDDRRRIPGWEKPEDLANAPAYFATLGALSVNYNAVCIAVGPGPEPGAPARVGLELPSRVVHVEADVETRPAGARRWLRVEREPGEGGEVTFRVRGGIPLDAPLRCTYRSVPDPLVYAGDQVRALLEDHGIRLAGVVRPGRVPEGATAIVRRASRPLSEILNNVNKFSNNFMAEQVLKAMGAEVHGPPGTTEKGLAVVRAYLEGLGVDPSTVFLVNGSGLTRVGRIAPSVVNAVLVDMARDPSFAPEFLASLSVAGMDGTLRRRFDEVVDRPGRIRGKTGSLDGVSALAAYVQAADGHTYAVTVMVEGFRRSRPVVEWRDRLGAALVAAGEGTSAASPPTAEGPPPAPKGGP